MKLYAIKTPENNLYWFAKDKHRAWYSFFEDNAHRLPIADAIRAYKAIGYKCVELKCKEQLTK